MDYYLIHKDTIKSALDKAKQYRLLLEPELAVSICLDIFAIDKHHQATLIVYILALSDNLAKQKNDKQILDAIELLDLDYNKKYYQGIYYERKALAMMRGNMSKSFAHNIFIKAIAVYKDAIAISPKDDDDAILRYNSCIRSIKHNGLEPRQDTDDVNWSAES